MKITDIESFFAKVQVEFGGDVALVRTIAGRWVIGLGQGEDAFEILGEGRTPGEALNVAKEGTKIIHLRKEAILKARDGGPRFI